MPAGGKYERFQEGVNVFISDNGFDFVRLLLEENNAGYSVVNWI